MQEQISDVFFFFIIFAFLSVSVHKSLVLHSNWECTVVSANSMKYSLDRVEVVK